MHALPSQERRRARWGRLDAARLVPAVVAGSVLIGATAAGAAPTPLATSAAPPPKSGYFKLVPPTGFAALPTDAQAAAMVHLSTWEPRPQNTTANHTVPPASFKTLGYSGMVNHAKVFGRVDGNYTGTTDEIIQWAAAKWGLPDEVIRAEAVVESTWYQGVKDASGHPVIGRGYGDVGSCGGSPPPSGYGVNGPASFGLLQDKWCSLKDADAAGYDGWPWTERSTAYAVDLYAATIRGCYQGWDKWLGAGYHAGDLWGCVGRWFSGQWYSTAATNYIADVKAVKKAAPWLGWSVTTATPVSGRIAGTGRSGVAA